MYWRPMEEISNREVLAAMAEAENRHDTSNHSRWFAPDAVVHLPGDEALEGLEAYCAFIDSLFVAFPDYHATAHERICEGNTVVHHWSLTGTHDGPLFGMPPSGRRINYRGASVFHLRAGKIVEAWLYPDRATMERQLTANEP